MSSTESCWLRQEVVEMCIIIIIIANSSFCFVFLFLISCFGLEKKMYSSILFLRDNNNTTRKTRIFYICSPRVAPSNNNKKFYIKTFHSDEREMKQQKLISSDDQ